ncbi:MAG: EAL domain-containing protein [Micromonosporaceae bacterium]
MDGRRRGVFIGVNHCPREPNITALRFAERDAVAVRDVLADPTIGTFDPADTVLLTGAAATAAAVKAALRSAALECGPSDVLLVYFAGHGVLPPWHPAGDPYLATSDTALAQFELNPELGLRMGFLRRDVFEVAAGSSFLVLDCCHAGGFADGERSAGRNRTLEHALDEIYARQLSRHSALLACPKDGRARERADLGHGVFTHHVLAALRGAAAGADGGVTFDELGAYLARQNLQPPPGFFLHGWGRTTVLTRPGRTAAVPAPAPGPPGPTATIEPLGSPLDGSVGPLVRLLGRAFREGRWPTPQRQPGPPTPELMVDLIRYAVEASGAALVAFAPQTHRIEAASGTFDAVELGGIVAELGRQAAAARRDKLGHVYAEQGGRQTLAVPLAHHNGDRVDCLIAVNPARTLFDMGEPLATALQALWRCATVHDALLAEVEVLTALRRAYGRLPLPIYHYCFDLYRQLVGTVVMVFEPVISLSTNPAFIGVHSWEALARRSETDRHAPVHLLEAAHVWGDQFIIERDRTLATRAILSYADAHAASSWGHGAPSPVSINVAVRSLLNDAYAETVDEARKAAGLGPSKVTLEISERDPIAPGPGEVWLPSAIAYFQARLEALARRLRVHFAMDDFGVGYSSLDRLSMLTLTQIKVDRAILHHDLVLDELSLVVKVAERAVGAPRAVVVEGFDDQAPVALRDIHQRGIEYVQGYITDVTASPRLQPLTEERRERIAAMLEPLR